MKLRAIISFTGLMYPYLTMSFFVKNILWVTKIGSCRYPSQSAPGNGNSVGDFQGA
jgi:hypothetical protein